MPWHLPLDLKFFKKTTLGKPVLMGRKTYEALGKPLPGRLNIVISATTTNLPEEVLMYPTLQAGIERIRQEDTDEGFIIGGGKVFESAKNLVDRMYITRIHTEIKEADAFFPVIDHSHWKLVWEEAHEADEKHRYAFTFQKFERIDL